MTTHFDPKYHSTQFINLHAARASKPGQSQPVATQPFKSLLSNGTESASAYTQAPESPQVEKAIAANPQPQVGGLWRKA